MTQKVLLGAAVLAFALAAQGFVYFAVVSPRQQAVEDLEAMTSALRAEAAQERMAQRRLETEPAALRGPADMSVPELLARVQEIAVNVNVHVHQLAPAERSGGEALYRMTMLAAYPDLIRFLARFESLAVEIGEMDIAPVEQGQDRLMVTLVFRKSDQGPAYSFADAAAFEERVRAAPPRDPFDAWAGAVAWRPQADSADLTWIHHLTGISQIGDMRTATIDNRDYRVGDRLAGRTIAEIGEESVTLTETGPGGERAYRIGFRYTLAERS